jgi:hypothetical protein
MIQKLCNLIYTLFLLVLLFLIGCSTEDDNGLNNNGNHTGTLNDGLVAYFPLDSNYTDASGNDNPLQAYGNPGFADGCCNESSTSVLLDGEEDYLVGSIGKLDTFSISMWLLTYKNYVGEWPRWRSTCYDYSNKQVYGYIDGSTGATQLHCGIESVPVASAYIPDFNNWFHMYIAVGNDVKIYINGQLEKTEAIQDTMVYSSDIIYFGRASSDDEIELTYFDGKLDEIRIYNRMLNQEEIKELSGNDNK